MPLPEGERAPLFSILVLLHKSVWMGDVMGAGVTEDEWNRHVNAIRRFPGRETPFLMYQEGELFCNFDPAAFCGRLCDTFHYILDVGAVVDRRAAWATVIDIVTERI